MLSTRVYPCPGCGKRMKSTSRFTKYMNSCTSQIIQHVLLRHMQPEQYVSMPGKNDNASDKFRLYEDEESIPEAQDREEDHRHLVGESSDTGSRARARRTPQDRLPGNELSSSLREVRFSEQEFSAGIPVSNIKYDHLGLQNDTLFYLFYNQLDYTLAHYFAKSESTKDNGNKFLSNPLIAPLTEKLSY